MLFFYRHTAWSLKRILKFYRILIILVIQYSHIRNIIFLQYLVIFDINKSNIVLPIIEDLEEKVVHYGFFRCADPEKPKLLCKDSELLATYGTDKVG